MILIVSLEAIMSKEKSSQSVVDVATRKVIFLKDRVEELSAEVKELGDHEGGNTGFQKRSFLLKDYKEQLIRQEWALEKAMDEVQFSKLDRQFLEDELAKEGSFALNLRQMIDHVTKNGL